MRVFLPVWRTVGRWIGLLQCVWSSWLAGCAQGWWVMAAISTMLLLGNLGLNLRRSRQRQNFGLLFLCTVRCSPDEVKGRLCIQNECNKESDKINVCLINLLVDVQLMKKWCTVAQVNFNLCTYCRRRFISIDQSEWVLIRPKKKKGRRNETHTFPY